MIHSDAVLSRPDTLNLTRAWMVDHIPAGSKVVIEPLVPNNWALGHRPLAVRHSDGGALGDLQHVGYGTYPTTGTPLPPGQHRYVLVDQYERTLRPALLDELYPSMATAGWSSVRSRPAAPSPSPRRRRRRCAYYAALATRAKLMYHMSPFQTRVHSRAVQLRLVDRLLPAPVPPTRGPR